MSAALIPLLRRLGAGKLRALAGETIIAAIEKVAPADVEKQVSQILLLKYGETILNQRDIRLGIMDVLDQTASLKLCHLIGKSALTHLQANKILREYFRSYGEKKSKQLVDFLGLSTTFYYKAIPETRTACEPISVTPGEQVRLKNYLHGYQKAIKDDIIDLLQKKGNRFFVQMPTGSGKTFTALEAVVDILRRRRRRKYVVWLVNSNELAEQALASFIYLWKFKGDHSVNAFRLFKGFNPGFSDLEGGVVFASFVQFYSIITKTDHPAYHAIWRLIKNSELLIVDEAHTSVAPTYEKCIRCFLHNDYTSVVGLSATPGRSNPDSTKDLIALYSDNLVRLNDTSGQPIKDPLGYLQEHSFLANLDCKVLETGITLANNEEDSLLATLASNSERNDQILQQIKLANEAKESTLVFACTLDHVLALSILCKATNIKTEYIIGDVDQVRRLDILSSFKKREFFILLNLDILSTGIDVPNINKIIITRPITSPILYSQILGRALRGPKNGGNETNMVVTIRDNLINFPSANFIYNMFALDWRPKTLTN
jgi:superfamily II DNA or RNA helicase